jgi:hypothetical protein
LGQFELVSPEGIVRNEKGILNRHPTNLDGKTILLHWNGKHNGDIFLNRLNELILEKVPGTKVLKAWEIIPDSRRISQNPERSREIAGKLAALKPDFAISAQGD